MKYIYVDYEQVIQLHQHILKISWWLAWTLKDGLIHSALELVQNDDYYPSFSDKLTHLVWSFCHNHCFADGNKRTSLAIWTMFILYNYDKWLSNIFIQEMEEIIVQVAQGTVTKESLLEYIQMLLEWSEDKESALLRVRRDIYIHTQ